MDFCVNNSVRTIKLLSCRCKPLIKKERRNRCQFRRSWSQKSQSSREFSQSEMKKQFSGSHIHQMRSLVDAGLIHEHGHFKYSFDVPLPGDFVRRKEEYIPDTALGECFR
jgi:hypothetical protein